MALTQKKSALSRDEVSDFLKNVPQWNHQDHSIVREFSFKDFKQAMNFTNRVAQIAEAQDHHPDIFISYNKVRLELTTHKEGGLTHQDFDLAKKIDQIL